MALSQSSHIHDQYETGGHLSSRTTPTSEPDSRATSGSRKRVPVAVCIEKSVASKLKISLAHVLQCERCRKRKIKCSGNEGDSQACANCKNSGLEDSCRFLRVSSVDPSQYGFRAWHGPPRYSPYSLPAHHRLNYVSVPSRCSPQSSLQYHPVPSGIEYGGYTNQSTSVDWGRAQYVGPYSPYPDDEGTSPYTTQPPPYILPNTDPMSTNNAYYIHGHGVRPHPGSLWPETQQYVPQPNAQATSTSYTMPNEAPQSFQTIGAGGSLPSDRILPQPISARSYIPTPASSVDLPISAVSQRSQSYWNGDSATSVQQMSPQADSNGAQEQHNARENISYRVQDLTYGQMGLGEVLSATSVASGEQLVVNEAQPAVATTAPAEHTLSQHSSLSAVSHQSLKSSVEDHAATYGYKGSANGHSSQSMSASNQSFTGPFYGRAMVPRPESGSDDCSPDCSSCQTTESTRTSITSINNTLSTY
ncbi:Fungal Zn2-Cys6 binuclear cluster domain-containing protein [Cladophialophora immunda]|nr:Fungal Zn2-Cys6 binuclear cluster domain-containing protein [Cladophialophora immunda]